jgi:hypothetical protein
MGSEEGNESECETRKEDTLRLNGVQTFSCAVQPPYDSCSVYVALNRRGA